MHRRRWLMPFIVVLIFIGILFNYQEYYSDNILATSATSPQYPWDENPSNIQKIEFRWQNEKIVAVRTGYLWDIVEPITIPADASYLYDIINTFSSPDIIDLLDYSHLPLESFGITDQSPSFTFYNQEDTAYTLIQGNPYDASHDYAYNPLLEELYIIPNILFDTLSTTLDEWYDRDYIHFSPEATDSIELTYAQTMHVIDVDTFNHTPEYTSKTLDSTQINHIIQFVSTSKIDKLITIGSTESTLHTYGFNESPLILKIYSTSGDFLEIQININNPTNRGYYVYLPQSTTLLSIPLYNINFSIDTLF